MATKIKCVVTGLEKGVRPAIYNKRVEKYGSEEELLRSYVSNEGKQLLREGLTVDEIRAQVNADATGLPSAADLADVVEQITSKKFSKGKKATAKKAEKVEEVEEEVKEEIDPDVSEFLGLDETEDAEAELANA